MREIVAGLAMTLDGVVESPQAWMRYDDEMADAINTGMTEADSALLGRRTALDFAELWPRPGTSTDGRLHEQLPDVRPVEHHRHLTGTLLRIFGNDHRGMAFPCGG